MKILFSGGGTLGPVTPLLALKTVIQKEWPQTEFVWVGTSFGPEKVLVEKSLIPFFPIATAKLRRYFSLRNFIDIFVFIGSFIQAFFLLRKEKPSLCISAGGYVSVPVHLAAFLLGIPTWIHQQDVQITLSNKLLAPISRIITVALEQSQKLFPKEKTYWMGNPVREEILSGSKIEAKKLFGIKSGLPVVLSLGGGTGAHTINQLIVSSLFELETMCEIIHITGKERNFVVPKNIPATYHPYPFLSEELKHAFALADIVISRGGFGTLCELAALKKTVLVIPKSGHQDKNALWLAKQEALVSVDEKNITPQILKEQLRNLLQDEKKRTFFGENLHRVLTLASQEKVIAICKKIFDATQNK